MPHAGISVATPSLLRAWKHAEYTELWLQFEPATNDDVMDEVAEAIIAANAAFPEDMGDSDFVFCEGPWLAPFGPPTYLATLSRTAHEAGVVKWLDLFADHLAAAGLTGRIVPAPTDDHASFAMVDKLPRPNLMTFLAYTVVNPGPSRRVPFTWNVDDDVTARIAAHVERGHFPRADTYLNASGRVWHTAPAPAAAALRRRLPADCIAGVTYLRPEPSRLTHRSFNVNGMSTYTVYDPQQSWQDLLDQGLDTMTAVPEATDLAFVQYSMYLLGGWDGTESELPALPGTQEYHFRYNPHLLGQFVPDARGAMLLTDAHLAHAHDLSGWSIEDVGHGRHLVQAPDLAAWFAQPQPSAEAVARARHDFGAMILTLTDIALNPPRRPEPS